MNKMMTISALALAAGAACAAVESENIVGYTDVEASANTFRMIGMQFEECGTGAKSVQDLVKGTFVGVDYGDGAAFAQTAPQIQIWTPTGYQTYFYLNDAYIDDDNMPAGWADSAGTYVTDTVAAGQAAWFKSSGACAVTTAGQVVGTAATIQTTANKFNMGAVPYPKAVEVNGDDITWTGLVGVDYGDGAAFAQTAPQIQIWTPSGYQTYFYLNDAYIDDDNMPAGWADSAGTYVTDTIPVGVGFWFKASTNVDIEFAAL